MSQTTKKIAFVTGGSRGIGAAIVKKLAAENYAVAFTYLNSTEKAARLVNDIEGTGGQALAIKANGENPEELTKAVDKAAAHFGHINVLVNNAAAALYNTYENYTPEEYNLIMSVNVQAPFFTTQAALKHMPDGSRIINIGSCLADIVPWPGITLYAMSKSALIGLTKGLARDLGPRKITVNLVQPGSTDTDMNPADGPNAELQRSKMAIPEYGKPENIASLVAWLAGEDAASVNGTALTIDGGANA